ncbi:MAG: LuxR C-terminal-related transcriptional regulator [Flavobacteriaceae bacterium]
MSAQLIPPVNNFSPNVYHAENQNWDVAIGDLGFVYVANSSGLLEFDGSRWLLYKQSNQGLIRSVFVSDNKVYTGGYMSFGFWERDSFGSLVYSDVSNKLIDSKLVDDEQIWNIVGSDKFIIYQSLRRLFIYDRQTKEVATKSYSGLISKVLKSGSSYFFQVLGQGLFEFSNGQFNLASDDPVFKKSWMVNLIENNGEYTLITQDDGFYVFDEDFSLIRRIPFELGRIYSAKNLNTDILLGTVSKGAVLIDQEGKVLANYCEETGLLNNTVLALSEDSFGNLWLGLDYGISLLNFNSKYAVHKDLSNSIGSVYSMIFQNGKLYVGTNQGLYYRSMDYNDELHFIEGSSGQVWSLQLIDDEIIVGHDRGMFKCVGTTLRQISKERGTWKVIDLRKDFGVLVQSNYTGVHSLKKVGDNYLELGRLVGIDFSTKKMIYHKGYLWIDHPDKRFIVGIKPNRNFDGIQDLVRVPKMNKSINSNLISLGESVVYFDENGFFELDVERKILTPIQRLTDYMNNREFRTGHMVHKDGGFMFFTQSNMHFARINELNGEFDVTRYAYPNNFRGVVSGFESIVSLSRGRFVLGGVDEYYTFLNKDTKRRQSNIVLRGVKVTAKNEKSELQLEVNKQNQINYDFNSIEFDIAVTNFDQFQENQLYYTLENYNDQWFPVGKESRIYFENLPFGRYSLRIRLGQDEELTEFTYDFEIERPYYLSTSAMILYLLFFLLFILFINRLNNFYYLKKQSKLQEETRMEMEYQAMETSQKLEKLKNEKLKNEIDLKNKEISLTTMSVANKNIVLEKVRASISKFDDSPLKKKAIKIIDNNINSNEDWELIEKTINSIDSGFLKRLQIAHPSLTHNDLKFCSHLRMNLSSKEIAPILNISVKSVEIKRYRLRKKMNLAHEVNLTDYILSI